VRLAGLGNFSFTAPTHTWIAENCCMGFGANLSLNYLNISSTPGLTNVGYSLATNIGPIAAINASTQGQFVNIGTSGGALTFSDVFQMSFEARTGDSTVPEPESFALVALGLVAAGLAGRRRVRRAD